MNIGIAAVIATLRAERHKARNGGDLRRPTVNTRLNHQNA
jgi:hypothetical protein